jgi:hypothetical protein
MVMRRRIETRGVDLLGLLAMAVDVSVEQITAPGKRSASNQGTKIRGKTGRGSGANARYGKGQHTCEQTFYRIVRIQASFRNLPAH